ncbi:MAG: lysoplasmalogenase family protein [bacterium]|nr:lysoplasmalogenase family protein [bacterium]
MKKDGREKDVLILRAAIGFTLVSDTFLLLTDYKELGVSTFIVVQLCYWYRLHKYKMTDLGITFLIWTCVVVGISIARLPLDFLLLITAFYFICLLRNVWYSLSHGGNLLFRIGLVLFLLCDLNVGLFNLTQYVSVSATLGQFLYSCSSVLIWVFYLPSQVCLSLSSKG